VNKSDYSYSTDTLYATRLYPFPEKFPLESKLFLLKTKLIPKYTFAARTNLKSTLQNRAPHRIGREKPFLVRPEILKVWEHNDTANL